MREVEARPPWLFLICLAREPSNSVALIVEVGGGHAKFQIASVGRVKSRQMERGAPPSSRNSILAPDWTSAHPSYLGQDKPAKTNRTFEPRVQQLGVRVDISNSPGWTNHSGVEHITRYAN